MKKLLIRLTGTWLNVLALFTPRRASQQAFNLFCRPFRTPLNPKQKTFFDSAEQFVVDSEGYPVTVLKWGSGAKNILFLHGWQSHTYRWKAYIESFSLEDYTIYSIEAPGHGLSEGSFLTVPVYSAAIRDVIHRVGDIHAVVSHSLGSFTLLYTLYSYPLLPIGKIVVMGAPGEASDFVEVFRTTLGVSSKVIRLIEERFVELYNVKPDYFSIRRFAGALNHPGLIIHDRGDLEAPFHHAENLNRLWRRSTLVTTENLGHNLKSKEVIECVHRFIHNESTTSQVRDPRFQIVDSGI